MGRKFFKKSTLAIVLILAIVLAFLPKTAVLANSGNESNPTIEYRAHVQDYGWMNSIKSGAKDSEQPEFYAGTTGQAKRLEALDITNQLPEGVELKARAHVQDIGWQDWKIAGKGEQLQIGTIGQCKRLEALQIVVTGLEGYEVKYRAHVQDIGWQDWVTASSDSDSNTLNVYAGTTGQAKRLEAFQIVLVGNELTKAKQKAIDELNGYLNPEEYSYNADTLENAITEGENAINAATTLEDVQTALDNAKAQLDSIPSDAKILAEAKSNAINEWQEEWIEKANSGTFDFEALEAMLNKWCDTIKESETVEAVKQALSDAKAELATVKSEEEEKALKEAISNTHNTFVQEFMDKMNNGSFSDESMEKAEEVLKKWINVIDNAESIEATEQAHKDAKAELDAIQEDLVHNVEELKKALENTKLETIYLDKGIYESTDLTVNRKVTIVGEENATIKGMLTITSSDVTLMNVNVTNETTAGTALDIKDNADNIVISGGKYWDTNSQLQGQGAIRIETNAANVQIKDTDLKGGIYFNNYTGTAEALMQNITNNKIALESTNNELGAIIIRTDAEDVGNLALRLSENNTFTFQNQENYEVLIHPVEKWDVRAYVKNNKTLSFEENENVTLGKGTYYINELKNGTTIKGNEESIVKSQVVIGNNVTIDGGVWKIEGNKQGEGVLRVMGSADKITIKNTTLYGGIYLDNYTGTASDLVKNIVNNTIYLEPSSNNLSAIIIRTDAEDVSDLAKTISENNTFHITNNENYEVLIHPSGEWTVKDSVKPTE